MKKTLFSLFLAFSILIQAQNRNNDAAAAGIAAGAMAITFLAAGIAKKEAAKQISQFRSKEYIINNIVGEAGTKEIKFETESLASDNDGGLISVAFNCDDVNERGLLLAFFGENRDPTGYIGNAYAFRYLPLDEAKSVLERLQKIREDHSKYLSADNNVNNVYVQHKEIKFVFYRENGNQIRVFWNGFEVIWEQVAFDRTKRRLDKWFK